MIEGIGDEIVPETDTTEGTGTGPIGTTGGLPGAATAGIGAMTDTTGDHRGPGVGMGVVVDTGTAMIEGVTVRAGGSVHHHQLT